MTEKQQNDDALAIEAIIDRQFRSLDWSEDRDGDWSAFKGDFHPSATLFPAARPAKQQTVGAFVERMKGLQTTLRTFRERMLGADVQVFGNVAVAMAACEVTENGESSSRGVEAFLLIKDEGDWKIVAQCWDTETDEKPIPSDLVSGGS